MKRLIVLLMCIFILSGCAASHMIKPDMTPELSPRTDAAQLVIIRDTFFGGAIVIWNYLDGKLIGETKGNTYFVKQVPPGPHYLVSATENTGVAHFDFKPGKIYYLRQGITVGVWRARTTGFYPMSAKEAAESIKGCTYWEYDPASGGEDMQPELFKKAVEEYEADIKENSEGYKELLSYDGYDPSEK
jgi:hypothetical protein